MIDNTRLMGGDRCADRAQRILELLGRHHRRALPGAYASLKEKPYYSEVIESVRQENGRMK